jgi:DNA ligase-1
VCQAIKKQRMETSLLQFHIFDVVDPNRAYAGRLGILDAARECFPTQVGLVRTEQVNNRAEIDALLGRYMEEGYEGLILRNGVHGAYEVGQRSTHLQKYKQFLDGEYLVVDVVDGVGREEGAGILVCATAKGQRFNVRPRGDYPFRRRMFQNRAQVIGCHYTVRYQNLTDDGIPRFPVGIAAREKWDR